MRRVLFRLRLLFLLGIVLILAGAILSAWTAWFVARAAEATGRVVKLEQPGDNPMWHLTFTFHDAAEKQHTIETRYFVANGSCPTIGAGDEVQVLYDPAVPQQADIDSIRTLWVDPLAIAGVGLIFSVGSALISLGTRALAKRQQRVPAD